MPDRAVAKTGKTLRKRGPIPVIGTPKPDGVNCAACHDTGHFFDQDGHGGYSWKRSCTYCR